MDIELHCTEAGSGNPLILLHGNGEDGTYFEHQIAFFSRRFHVFAPERTSVPSPVFFVIVVSDMLENESVDPAATSCVSAKVGIVAQTAARTRRDAERRDVSFIAEGRGDRL